MSILSSFLILLHGGDKFLRNDFSEVGFIPVFSEFIASQNSEGVSINCDILANSEISRVKELIISLYILVFALFQELSTHET